MDNICTAVELPYPPTVNTYWRHWRGRTVISPLGRRYKQEVGRIFADLEVDPTEGRVSISALVMPPDRRKRDIDNIAKALLDALVNHVYFDDCQIVRLYLERGEKIDGGKIILTATEVKQ